MRFNYNNVIVPLYLMLVSVSTIQAEDSTFPPASEELSAAHTAFYKCINWDQNVFRDAFFGCSACTGAKTTKASFSTKYTCQEFNTDFCTAYESCTEECLVHEPCGPKLKEFMLVAHYEGFEYQDCGTPYSCPGDAAAAASATTTGGAATADKSSAGDTSGSYPFMGTADTTTIIAAAAAVVVVVVVEMIF